jgi:uncharacterized protein (DUF736 family)
MIVGTFQPKTNSEGKAFYDLQMKIPFQGNTNFYVIKNDKKTTDNQPDMKIFYAGNQAGAIWKKTSKAQEDYLSGTVFCLGMPTNRISFAIFKAKDVMKKDEAGNQLNLVVISEGDKQQESHEEDHLPAEVF